MRAALTWNKPLFYKKTRSQTTRLTLLLILFSHFVFFPRLLSPTVFANEWKVFPSNDAHWMETSNESHQELFLAKEGKDYHFLLASPVASESTFPASIPVTLTVDNKEQWTGKLQFLEKREQKSLFKIEVPESDKEQLIVRMISGLNLYLTLGKEGNVQRITNKSSIVFSLSGFTVAYNDLLIADEIGSLDKDWLLKQKKNREYFCISSTETSISATINAQRGLSKRESLKRLKKTGSPELDNHMNEIISQIYTIPHQKLPMEPRAEKYLLFKRCMKQIATFEQ